MGQRVAGRILGLPGLVCGAVGIAVVDGISIELAGLCSVHWPVISFSRAGTGQAES